MNRQNTIGLFGFGPLRITDPQQAGQGICVQVIQQARLPAQGRSGNATEEEIGFLRKLKLRGKRPTALYYYRELQNRRDPLHFRAPRSERNAAL